MDQKKIDWQKMDGLIPAVVQDQKTKSVLMLGYMSPESWSQTLEDGFVTFWSRSKQRLWKKGETSGNTLKLSDWKLDCDGDTLLLSVDPAGPVCHTGDTTCFGNDHGRFLDALESLVHQRVADRPKGSYTTNLLEAGLQKIGQKVGEEGLETALEAASGSDERLISESADLVYHLIVLLQARGLSMSEVEQELERRHRS
ncbi:bifunctional phosphoribosyl-AMP cyclohydrolase/phosphoribosyl-ATP diphosphatase HisIE [Cryomorphaceae bacterium]|nr:bifunctional phosphoribosyl-AMP cyclohydrolase/phosphoribosyl-ATP diphosphatase HisIE [Cryomorphaceae bacterium]